MERWYRIIIWRVGEYSVRNRSQAHAGVALCYTAQWRWNFKCTRSRECCGVRACLSAFCLVSRACQCGKRTPCFAVDNNHAYRQFILEERRRKQHWNFIILRRGHSLSCVHICPYYVNTMLLNSENDNNFASVIGNISASECYWNFVLKHLI